MEDNVRGGFEVPARLGGLGEDAIVATVYAYVFGSTVLLGIATILAARAKAGRVLQQFPPSVICAYLGCLGSLIVEASLSMVAGGEVRMLWLGEN